MGFRGCDEEFAEGLELARKYPREFSAFVKFFVAEMQKTDKYREELGKQSRENYGVGFCPFHAGGLFNKRGKGYLVGFRPDSFILKLDGKKHKFHRLDCGQLRHCDSIISFDEELLEELTKRDLKRVVSSEYSPRTLCPACGSQKGKVYDTGVRVPQMHQVLIENEPLYLFERSCHIYAAATTEGIDLYPITRSRHMDGEIHLAIQR